MRQTFSKDERLRSHLLISKLFAEGSTFYLKPFRVTWMRQATDNSSPVQVMMSVPKYNFRRAVQRNLIRRRMKEAYRLNKHLCYQPLEAGGQQLVVCITYTAKEIVPFDQLQLKIILLLQRLTEENEKIAG
ncbi:MAG: ribonuclease P protein component [Bacteroidota bacterium]